MVEQWNKDHPDKTIEITCTCLLYTSEIGKGVTLREGTDVAIIATGLCVAESLAAAEKLAADGRCV